MTTRHWTFNDLLAALKHNVGQSTMPEIAGITQIRKHVAKISLTATLSAVAHGPNYYAYPAWFTKGLHNWWTLAGFETKTGTDGVRDSRIGNWLDFDGTDDEVHVTDQTAVQNIFGGGGTIEAWIYPRSDGESSSGIIVSKGDNTNDRYLFYVVEESGSFVKLRFQLDFASGNGVWTTTTATIPLNQWTHVAVTFDSDSNSNNPILYQDGVLETLEETTTPSGSAVSDVGNNLLIGDIERSLLSFDGYIGDVRLWNDIRTATELLDSKDLALQGDEAGLAGLWKLNEGAGTVAKDTTTNKNTGTITGATWGATTYHGTINGNPTLSQTFDDLTKGTKRHFTTFDGSGDFINVGDITVLDGATKMTWGFRIRIPTGAAFIDVGWLATRWPSADGDKQFQFRTSTSGGLHATFATDGIGGIATGSRDREFSADTWVDTLFVYDGGGAANSDRLKIYIDGVSQGLNFSNTIPTSLQVVAADVLIGRQEGGASDDFEGDIQDVVFWSSALTAAQALAWTTDSISDRIVAGFFKVPGDFINEVLPTPTSYIQPNPRRRRYRNGYKHQITNQV